MSVSQQESKSMAIIWKADNLGNYRCLWKSNRYWQNDSSMAARTKKKSAKSVEQPKVHLKWIILVLSPI